MDERANRILKLIEKNNISYGELSKKTNIPKSALQRYATGETKKIPIDRVELIAVALGSSAAYIMGWEKEKPAENIDKLSEREKLMFELFNQVPEKDQPMVLEMIKAALKAQGLL